MSLKQNDSLNQKPNNNSNNTIRLNNDESLISNKSLGESSSNTKSNGTTMTNSNAAPSKYQLLKQKKLELEKRLNEKYNQLQQVCREEAQIIGVYPIDFGSTEPPSSANSQNNTLRRKVGTSFKLPENLLSNREDDINKLLLEKQIQLQICEASLRLASDASLAKSVIRTHKQNYEAAQQKLIAINQNISKLRKQQNAKPLNNNNNHFVKQTTQDDINLHKSPVNIMNAPTPTPSSSSVGILNMSDRRNLTKSNSVTNSPSTSHKGAPRMRHDSVGTARNEYAEICGKMSPLSHTTGYQSFNQNYHQQLQQLSPHYHYSSATTIGAYPPKSPNYVQIVGSGGGSGSAATSSRSQHYHHNTMPLRQLNSSPLSRYSANLDANGNDYFNYAESSLPPSRPESSLVERIESVQQAPGGYWLSMANNERVWFPLDNKYNSLDRRNLASKKLLPTTKSTSMGNIADPDTISINSASSESKRREKNWQETALDEPGPLPPRIHPSQPQSPAAKRFPSQHDSFLPSDIENANTLHPNPAPPPPKLIPRNASQASATLPHQHQHNMNNNNKLVRAPSLEPQTSYTLTKALKLQPIDVIERPASVMIQQMVSPTAASSSVSPTNSLYSPEVTVVQQGKIQPYKEEEKPFEMADFYKYSTKFRQKQPGASNKG